MSNATRDLTGQVAIQVKLANARMIQNEFLEAGTACLHEGDVESAVEEVYLAQARFRKFGIDIKTFLETGEVR